MYLTARMKLRSGWSAVAFAAAYLLLPALEAANLFEFHAVVMAPFFLLFAFYFVEKAPGRQPVSGYVPAFIFALLAMSCKEDIPLVVVMMGLYFIMVSRKWNAGLPLIFLASLWFYVAIYVVFPAVRSGEGSPFMRYYEDFGDNPFSIVFTLLTQPRLTAEILLTQDNLSYMVRLLFPFGFLPILGLPVLLIAAPSLGINLLSSFPLMHELEAKQYAVPIVPFVALAAVYGTLYLSHRVKKDRATIYLASGLVLICSVTYQYVRGFSPLSQAYESPQVTAHHKLADQFIQQIPPDAPLIAQDRLFPHVSQRERVYYVWTPATDADYILLDISHPSFNNTNNVHQWLKDQVETQEEFGLVTAEDGYLLLKREAPATDLPEDFYSFVRAEDAQIQYPMSVDFDSGLRFLGFDIIYDRDREVNFMLYWQAVRPLEQDYNIQLHLVNAVGDVIQSTSTPQPTLVWYPTSNWEPENTIKVLVNTLPWSTKDHTDYGVALSVSQSGSAEEGEVSLLPKVNEAPQVTRLLADGSLLEFARFYKRWGLHHTTIEPRTFDHPKMPHDLAVNYNDLARLEGFSFQPQPPIPGQDLQIELLWHPLTPISESFTVFVHLIDSGGKIWAQQDNLPGQGTLPTTAWIPGEYIRDGYTIHVPEQAPPDGLELAIGLYRADTAERLGILNEDGQIVDDHAIIQLQ
jgi:uncharacterized membrane protein